MTIGLHSIINQVIWHRFKQSGQWKPYTFADAASQLNYERRVLIDQEPRNIRVAPKGNNRYEMFHTWDECAATDIADILIGIHLNQRDIRPDIELLIQNYWGVYEDEEENIECVTEAIVEYVEDYDYDPWLTEEYDMYFDISEEDGNWEWWCAAPFYYAAVA